jgi:hypothetical protein
MTWASVLGACSLIGTNGLTGSTDGGADDSHDAAPPFWIDGADDTQIDGSDAGVDRPTDAASDTPSDAGVDSTSVDAAPAIVRVQSLAPGWVSSATTTVTLDENAGDLLVAGVYFAASNVTVSVRDSLGNTWTPTTAYVNSTANCSQTNASVAQIFFAEGISAGKNILTVQQSSGTSPLGVFVVEYSGVRGVGALDGVTGGAATSSTATMNPGTLTTTGALDLVVALFSEATTSGTMTPGPGFVTVQYNSTFYSLIEDNLPNGTGAGAVDPTATEPGGTPSSCWSAAAVAFRATP